MTQLASERSAPRDSGGLQAILLLARLRMLEGRQRNLQIGLHL